MNYEWLILYRDNLIAQAANLFADGRTVDGSHEKRHLDAA